MFHAFENLVDPFAPAPDIDRPDRGMWRYLANESRGMRWVLAAILAMMFVVAAVEIGLVAYLGRLVDLMSSGPPDEVLARYGLELVLVGLAVLFARPALFALTDLLLHQTLMPTIAPQARWRAHRHVLRQSIAFFENDFAGRIANRLMQAPSAAGDALFEAFDALAYAFAYFTLALVLLGSVDPRLLLPVAVWMLSYALLVRWVVARVTPASKEASDARSTITGRIVDSYTNIHSVKMFAHHDRELDYALHAMRAHRHRFAVEMRIYTIMNVSLWSLNGIFVVAIVGWAIWLWAGGAASVGIVAAATAIVLRLSDMTGWIMHTLTGFFRNLGVLAEGLETITEPLDLVDAPGARPLAPGPGRIELRAVSHHYGRGAGGLGRVSLTVAPGEKVGLVGRSGSGKSTLVKLILRFYDAEGGTIAIDGQDVAGVTQESLRGHIGMVQQDSALLHRSVRDNILYGRPEATEAQMIAAARQAEAHDFVQDLADPQGRTGYDAHVGERGVKLSGGQRQRIALARVILKDAPILMLDEATSALDSEVEAAIQSTLYGMMAGKTVIAIAHRLSTIARMDRIVVLDQGRIVEEGTHQSLLDRGGLYAAFWAAQSGGFIDTAGDDAGRHDTARDDARGAPGRKAAE